MSSFCFNCGARLEQSSKFCGSCGSPIRGSAAHASEDDAPPAPTPSESSSGSDRTVEPRGFRTLRKAFVLVGAGAVLVLGMVVVLSFSSRPSEASLEPVSGVRMEVPEGWVVASESPTQSEGVFYPVILVPEEFEYTDPNGSDASPVEIHISKESPTSCTRPEDGDRVHNGGLDAEAIENLQESGFAGPQVFLSDTLVLTGKRGAGESRVNGARIEWFFSTTYSAASWQDTQSRYVDHPNYLVYTGSFFCLPDDDTVISLNVEAALFPRDAERAASEGLFGPNEDSNAYRYYSIVEVNDEAKALYEENSPVVRELLESVDTGSLLPMRSDLSGMPSELTGEYALSTNPFEGELEEPEILDLSDDLQYEPEEDAGDYEEEIPGENIPDAQSEPQMVIGGDTPEEQFVNEYFGYVNARDWSSTYDLLDSNSRAVFTETGWEIAQDAREEETETPPLQGVSIGPIAEDSNGGFSTDVTLEVDGEDIEIPGFTVVLEDGEYRRFLSDEDESYLVELVDYENPSGG